MAFAAEVGHSVAGKYELVRLLGRGSMGEVWLARHMTLAEEVAVKFLTVEPVGDEDPSLWLSRFLFEAQIAARLSRRSRHIVRVTDHGEESGTAYLVMERLEGESVAEALGRLPLEDVRRVVRHVARGLAQAHEEGVIHRDLKPANIFLSRDEDQNVLAKILDFGIARAPRPKGIAVSTRPTTERGLILGTTSHMSPEQGQGLASLDHRCDLWALGVVTYEMLTGALPFVGETTEEIFASVFMRRFVALGSRKPGLVAFEPFFERAFAANIEERFQTAHEFAEAFDAVPAAESEEAERSGLAVVATRENALVEGRVALTERNWLRSRAPTTVVIVLACAAVAAITATTLLLPSGTKTAAPRAALVELAAPPPASPVPAPVVEVTQPPASSPPVGTASLGAARPLPVAKKPPPPPRATSTTKKHLDKGEIF